ncbi:Hypothetical predicted protein [Mytilus galloprovincialis]|uniref:Reverse transcriptase domain-containing protein n=1 Tax=Mytilus galloprovincialis TaxID=29158 RepID=A0A8B6G1B2_MYTGA|nr:Hypothetical predicted protein [Mytilus galloprovincialis]
MDEETRHKSAFITRNGVYEWLRLPFGLRNSPVSFQMIMTQVLRGLNWKFVLVYVDDILIFSKTFEEHLRHLEQVFNRLRDANLTLKPTKCQLDSQGREHVIAYGGRSLSRAERIWCTTEQECLAVLEGVKHFRAYLTRRFRIFTDHKALKYLMDQKVAVGKLGRWALKLQDFDFDIVHKPDLEVDNKGDEDLESVELELFYGDYTLLAPLDPEVVNSELLDIPAVGQLQQVDPDFQDMFNYLQNDVLPQSEKVRQKVLAESQDYSVCDGVLYKWFQKRFKTSPDEKYIKQLCLPLALRRHALLAYHDLNYGGAHLGLDRVLAALRQKYFWPKNAPNSQRPCSFL